MIFLMKDKNSKYMEKLACLSLDAHEKAGIEIKFNTEHLDSGYLMTLWETGDVLILQSLDKGELKELNNIEFYDNYIFVDYRIAPELIYKTLDRAGLRNSVYKFSVIDEKGV